MSPIDFANASIPVSAAGTVELERAHHIQLYRRYPVTLVRGEGVWVWDDKGKRYLDMLAGIAVNNTGHCHPAVVAAIREQAGTLIHTSNFYFNEPQARLCALLTQVSGLDRVFLTNSGLEAMELCVKIARKSGHNRGIENGRILAVEGGFHGRSLAAIALGKPSYQKGFGPMPEGLGTLPFGDEDALREAFAHGNVLAVAFETVQGEGGIRPQPRSYLALARELCDRHGALLIADEVQCGNGRTGTYFAIQSHGVRPDVIATAKGLGGGFPVGAVLMAQHAADVLTPGDHGTTYGGGPLACAAAEAAVSAILEQDLAGRARELGAWFMDHLRERIGGSPLVKEIRGVGLMIGIELTVPGRPLVEGMLERGILGNVTMDTVLRLVPPLVVERPELEWFTGQLHELLAQAEATV